MNRSRSRSHHAFTRVELLAALLSIGVLVLMLASALVRAKAQTRRIGCISRLKNIGLSMRVFSTDNGGLFPFQRSTNGTTATNHPVDSAGGTLEFAQDPASAWRHFAALSNELGSPVIARCPADKQREATRNWAEFTTNKFLSYTVGLSASADRPQTILSCDRNLVINGASVSNALVSLHAFRNDKVIWDQRIHVNAGNVLLGDGSVQQVTSGRLSEQFRDAAVANPEPQKLVVP